MAADLEGRRNDGAFAPLRVHVDDDGDAVEIRPHGEIDMTSAPRFADALVVAANEGRPLLVDLSGVTFMDSTGLDALIRGHRLLASRGLPLTIRNTSSTVRQLIEVTGTGPLLGLDDQCGALTL